MPLGYTIWIYPLMPPRYTHTWIHLLMPLAYTIWIYPLMPLRYTHLCLPLMPLRYTHLHIFLVL